MVERGHDRPAAESQGHLGYERSDASVRGILIFAAGLVVFTVVICVVLWWMHEVLVARDVPAKARPSVLAATKQGQLPPEPRLEGITPREEASTRQEADQSALRQYGWADRKAGIARIPVDEAISILADKLPSRPEEKR